MPSKIPRFFGLAENPYTQLLRGVALTIPAGQGYSNAGGEVLEWSQRSVDDDVID
jgi:hypothetical protein